jgi:hypothetical protein
MKIRSSFSILIRNYPAVLICYLLFGLVNSSQAGVIMGPTGYEVSYNINLGDGTPTGGDILNTFIFEWDDNSNRAVDYTFEIAGSGSTTLSHITSFLPTHALVIGYLDSLAGVGDEKRHLYTLIDNDYSNYITNNLLGTKFSTIFGQGEQFTIDLLGVAAGADVDASAFAIEQLWGFVTGAALKASFNPNEKFRVHKWSIATPPVDVPEPTPLALLSLSIVGLYISRKKRSTEY